MSVKLSNKRAYSTGNLKYHNDLLSLNPEIMEYKMRLLVVDDNEEITYMIRYYCTKGNIDCEVTNNGIEPLEKLRQE